MSPGKRGAAAARGRGMDRGIDLGAAFGAAARSLGGLRGGLAAVTSPAEVADAAAEETAKLFATKLNQVHAGWLKLHFLMIFNAQCPRIRLRSFAHVFCESLQSISRDGGGGSASFTFMQNFRGYWGLLRLNFSSEKKVKRKRRSTEDRQGCIEHAWKPSGSILEKRRGRSYCSAGKAPTHN